MTIYRWLPLIPYVCSESCSFSSSFSSLWRWPLPQLVKRPCLVNTVSQICTANNFSSIFCLWVYTLQFYLLNSLAECMDEQPVLHIKEEPIDENHSNDESHDNYSTNHVEEQKNGRQSPESPTNEKPVLNNKHCKQNNNKDLKPCAFNTSLRNLVIKEIRKPGKSKYTCNFHNIDIMHNCA